jgi:hypothetical protein
MTKPECKLVESEGNIYSLMGYAFNALKCAGFPHEAKEMITKIRSEAKNSDYALQIIKNYVNVV